MSENTYKKAFMDSLEQPVTISLWYRLIQPVLMSVLLFAIAASGYVLYILWPRIQLILFSATTQADAGCGCSALFSFTDQPFVNTLTLGLALAVMSMLSLFIAALVVNALQTQRIVRQYEHIDVEPLHVGTTRYQLVTIDSGEPHVFTAGVYNPRIVIDAGVRAHMSESELRSVLWHEVGHIARRDTFKKWLLFSFIDMWAWMPITQQLRVAVETAQELLADEYALQRTQRLSLLRAFTALAETRHWQTAIIEPAPVPFFRIGDARLQGLLLQPVSFPFAKRLIGFIVVVVGVFVGSTAIAHGEAGGHSQLVVHACVQQMEEHKTIRAIRAGMSVDTATQCEAVLQSVDQERESVMPGMTVLQQ